VASCRSEAFHCRPYDTGPFYLHEARFSLPRKLCLIPVFRAFANENFQIVRLRSELIITFVYYRLRSQQFLAWKVRIVFTNMMPRITALRPEDSRFPEQKFTSRRKRSKTGAI
jgi:hypothetical protein